MLGIVNPQFVRDDESIGDDVVDVFGTHRAWVTQEVDLNRRRTTGKNVRLRVAGKTHQVDRDVDFQSTYRRRNFRAVLATNVDEPIDTRPDPVAHGAGDVGTHGESDVLKSHPIVLLEHPGNEIRRGVIVKVAGQESHANAVMVIPRSCPKRAAACRVPVRHMVHGARKLYFGLVRDRQRHQGHANRLPEPYSLHDALHVAIATAPIAHPRSLNRDASRHVRVIGD